MLGAATAFEAEPRAPLLAGAAAAIVLVSAAVATRRTAPIPLALLLLGVMYALPDGDRAVPAPVYGGALLLTAELAYWSLDEHLLQRVEPGLLARRLVAILAVVAAAILAGAVVLAASDAGVARSAAVTAAGAAAVVACAALLAALASRDASGR